MVYADIAFADKFLANYPGGESWATLSEGQKENALQMASYAIDASGPYRIPTPTSEDVSAAASIEALARTDEGARDARSARDTGITAASMGHASESYRAVGADAWKGALWSADAAMLMRRYLIGCAPIVKGACRP